MFLRVDRPKEIKCLTLCLWVYIDSRSNSGATIVLFGKKLGVKIYYGQDLKFVVGFYGWNRWVDDYTNLIILFMEIIILE